MESSWKKIGGGAVSVSTYAEAVALATQDNIGQVIYVSTSSEYDADGDGVVDNASQLGGIPADQYALKTDIESSIASDEDATQVIDDVFNSSSVATEEEVSDVINSVFN